MRIVFDKCKIISLIKGLKEIVLCTFVFGKSDANSIFINVDLDTVIHYLRDGNPKLK